MDDEYNEYANISQVDTSPQESSSSEIFYKSEEIEEEIASFLELSVDESQNFMLICEWAGCDEAYPLNENPSYLFHVQTHVHHLAELFFSGVISKFTCSWNGCTKPDEGIVSELEFARHLLYHPFHQKLKVRGLIALQTHKIYVPCQLDASYKNMVPDFPSAILCKWGDCNFKCNCITSFDDHINMHIHEDFSTVHNTRTKRRNVFYTCKWSECPGYTVDNQCKLREHTQKHTNLRQYACAGCGGLFCTKFKFLDHHRRQATVDSGFILDNLVYQCTYCNKKYPTEGILRNHMRSHVYNFLCQYCHNTFSTQSGLRKHIIYRHRKERMYACRQCEYRAKDRYDLGKHVERTHQDKQGFTCAEEGCTYKCYNEDSLALHLKMKHNPNPRNYMCHVCNKKFGEGRVLSRHLVRIHDYRRPTGVGKFRYSCEPDGFYRLQKIKYESKRLVTIKELHKKAERSLLALGVSPNTNMELVITTDTGEEQQVTFVPYKNALKELTNNDEPSDGECEDNFAEEQSIFTDQQAMTPDSKNVKLEERM